jgi:phosphatidylethanolamine/phosphatidyl-N-methylethanolamine N-methyltransferase
MTPLSRQGIVRTYHAYAPFYDILFGAILDPGRRALAETVQALGPKSLLEVGVGTGLMLERYPPATKVHGIDLSDTMLEKARLRIRHLADRDIRLASMNAEAMSYSDDSFECVTLPYVLSVTPNPRRLVAEVRRVCRKGGVILVLNHFSGEGVWRGLEKALCGVAGWIGFHSEFLLEEHILSHDWEICSLRKVNAFGLSCLIAIRN